MPRALVRGRQKGQSQRRRYDNTADAEVMQGQEPRNSGSF